MFLTDSSRYALAFCSFIRIDQQAVDCFIMDRNGNVFHNANCTCFLVPKQKEKN
jgi:hypothetical protein